MPSVYSKKTPTDWQLRIDYTSEQSISGNSSTMDVSLYVYSGTAEAWNQDTKSAYYILCGFKTYKPYSYPTPGWHKLGSRTLSLKHEDDGSRTAHLTAEWHSGVSSNYTPAKIELVADVDLPKIPRVSKLSFGRLRMGKASTITINRASSSFKDKLSYSFGDLSGTIVDRTSAGSVSWTPPTGLATQIPKAPSGSGTLTVRTYQGETYIGKRSYTFVADVPSDAAPGVSATLADGKGLVAKYGAYVQHQSTLQATIKGTAKYGASIKSHSLTVGGAQYNGREITTAPVPESGTVTVRYGVKDSRGKSTSDTQTITVLPWAPPGVSRLTASRCSAEGGLDPEGAFGRVTFSGRISPLEGHNLARWRIKYRPMGGDVWTEVLVPEADGQYTPAGVAVVIPADIGKGYDVCVVGTDDFGPMDSTITTLSPAMAFYRMSVRKKSFTWGEERMEPETFRVAGIFKTVELPAHVTSGGKSLVDWEPVPLRPVSTSAYSVAIERDSSEWLPGQGQVMISAKIRITVKTAINAGEKIPVATLDKAGLWHALNIYPASTNPRVYTGHVGDGQMFIQPNTEMGAAEYVLFVDTAYRFKE